MDYASRLDAEETNREYLNSMKSDYYSRAASLEPVSTYRRAYHSTSAYGGTTSFDYKVSLL